jgi:hypothetical protein
MPGMDLALSLLLLPRTATTRITSDAFRCVHWSETAIENEWQQRTLIYRSMHWAWSNLRRKADTWRWVSSASSFLDTISRKKWLPDQDLLPHMYSRGKSKRQENVNLPCCAPQDWRAYELSHLWGLYGCRRVVFPIVISEPFTESFSQIVHLRSLPVLFRFCAMAVVN